MWDQLQDDLIWDGALRDIYVENTSHEEWRTFLSWLLASHHVVEYLYGDEPRSLPSDPRDLFQQRDQPHSIRVNVGGAWLHSHCFTPEEIDLDFWPTEVKNPEALWDLILFLSQLATALGRDVIVTHEGSRETVFLVLHGGRYRSGD